MPRKPARRLYWSIRGEVACETHAPDPAEPRWDIEGWQPLPSRAQRRAKFECQHCGREINPIWMSSSIN